MEGKMKDSSRGFVRIEGTAYDAKGGAVLRTDDAVVYIAGKASWPADVVGGRVRATGILSEEKIVPDPEVGADGAVSAGAAGLQKVLKDSTWEILRR